MKVLIDIVITVLIIAFYVKIWKACTHIKDIRNMMATNINKETSESTDNESQNKETNESSNNDTVISLIVIAVLLMVVIISLVLAGTL